MNRQIFTVYKKEMRDMIRDRRALFAVLSFAVGVPVFMTIISILLEDDATPYNRIKIAVAGLEQAPGLEAALVNADYDLIKVPRPAAIPAALPKGVQAFIIVGDGFQEQLAVGKKAPVTLYMAGASVKKIKQSARIQGVVHHYSQSIASARLLTRGFPIALLDPLDFQVADLAEESFQVQYISDSFTLLFLMAPFVASMSVAIDTLAGERERHSLQSLLTKPVSGRDLLLGKWAMVSTFALAGTLLTCLIFFLSLDYVLKDTLDIAVYVNPFTFIVALCVLAPYAMLVASLQLLISIQVKSFKEGQTYVSMLMFVPVFFGYAKVIASDRLPEAADHLPIISNMVSLGGLLYDNEMMLMPTLLSIVYALVGLVVCLGVTARLVDHERLLDAA